MSVALASDVIATPDGRQRVYFHSSEYMQELEDGSVDLVCTSSPYGLGLDYSNRWRDGNPMTNSTTPGQVERPTLSMDDYRAYVGRLNPIWKETYRVLAPGGFAAINIAPIHAKAEFFGRSFMFPIVHDIETAWMGFGAELQWKYIWVAMRTRNSSSGKPTTFLGSYGLEDPVTHEKYGIPLKGQVLREIEEVLIFKKPPFDAPLSEEREARRRQSRITFEQWQDIFSQVWEFNGEPKKKGKDVAHPATFPLELPMRVLRGYSCLGDLVLDPFCGTATTGLAARILDRRFVGYEVETIYRPLIEEKLRSGEAAMEAEW